MTSDEEHPGLLGALAAARELRGVTIREVPLARGRRSRRPAHAPGGLLARRLGERLARSRRARPSWTSRCCSTAPRAWARSPVDVQALGCDAYAGAGQKWLCGPDGTGMLYVSPSCASAWRSPRRGYANLAEARRGAATRRCTRTHARFDSPALSAEAVACALAAIELLESAGWAAVHERARELAARLAELLAERGREPAPRGDTTLVSFPSADPPAERGAAGRGRGHRA